VSRVDRKICEADTPMQAPSLRKTVEVVPSPALF